jgi:hypothetical protein
MDKRSPGYRAQGKIITSTIRPMPLRREPGRDKRMETASALILRRVPTCVLRCARAWHGGQGRRGASL